MTDSGTQKIINCTPHTLNIYDGGRKVATFPPGDEMIRIAWLDGDDFEVAGLPVVEFRHGAIGLPAVRGGVWYVVSYVAALGLLLAGEDRPDILIPGPKVTDRGRVVGCRGFRRVVR